MLPMTGKLEKLNLNSVMIVGVNTRPIVKSARAAGLKPVAVDSFGDVDLRECAEAVYCTRDNHYSFLEAALEALDNHEIDATLLTSGTEHDPRIHEELSKRVKVIANKPERVQACEDKEELYKIADELEIAHPETRKVSNADEALDAASEMGFPVVLKPVFGGCGIGIEFAEKPGDIENLVPRVLEHGDRENLYVQKHVKGVDASASVLSTGEKARCLTVNEQVIGEEKLGAPSLFRFCGNIVPIGTHKLANQTARDSERLCEKLKLVGSNGVDFVLADKQYLIEVNPRFQSTIDCVERVVRVNLVKEHLQAYNGEIGEYREPEGFVSKFIVYARKRVTAPDLNAPLGIFDVTPEGKTIEKGDPICSVMKLCARKEDAVNGGYSFAQKVYSWTGAG